MGPELEPAPTSLESPTALKAAALSPLVAHAPLLVARGRAVALPATLETARALRLEPYRRWSDASSLFASVSRASIGGVRRRGGVTYYVIDVHLALPSSRLPVTNVTRHTPSPTHSNAQAVPSTTDPNAQTMVCQVERRYSDFERLRHQVLANVSALPQCQCQYCLDFMVYLRFGRHQPGGLHKLACSSVERRQKALDAFLNELLVLAQAPAVRFEHRNGRHANRERVHATMEAFLLEPARQQR